MMERVESKITLKFDAVGEGDYNVINKKRRELEMKKN